MTKGGLSIIIPTYNEEKSIAELIKRLRSTLFNSGVFYEVIFIDDNSTDGTVKEIRKHIQKLPLRIYIKNPENDKKGKAESLLVGFKEARFDNICMIDADLQYPPEAILPMYKKLENTDIVVANRKFKEESKIRIILSKGFRTIFGKFLLGLDCDVQSGLKVFKKDTLKFLNLNPSKWGFDFEFLFKAKKLGHKISDHDILFSKRFGGESKIEPILSSIEIGRAALLVRLFSLASFLKFLDYFHSSEKKGNDWNNRSDYLFMPEIFSVKKHLLAENIQLIFFFLLLHILSFFAVTHFWKTSFVIYTFVCVNIFYLFLMIFKFYIIYRSLRYDPIIDFGKNEIDSIKDCELPVYSVIIPLYQEEGVIGQIKKAMTAIDYPSYKLDFVITLEEYDYATRKAVAEAEFPRNFRILILPDVKPKTKPKALNVVFSHLDGDFFTIYDAEIIPDKDQLKKACLLFKKYPDISCIQTLLDHYNYDQNILTKWFNAEFAFYYDMFLPGLQSLNYPIPLSGHSTHFRIAVVQKIGAWDPYNVAEDCDLGIRLRRFGYKTAIMRSYSREEATSNFKNWLNQRSRWMKGFLQTTIVHMRHPFRFKDELGGWRYFIAFLLLVPGTVIINFSNLGFWILFILWIVFQPQIIKDFFPGIILHISVLCFLLGNFIFIYLNLIGLYQRKRFSLVKYSLLTSIYWIMLSLGCIKAVAQLITNPYHWEKTKHGDHLAK
ncbi:MAG: glycosyltransferase [Minisyncoccia bacterium]